MLKEVKQLGCQGRCRREPRSFAVAQDDTIGWTVEAIEGVSPAAVGSYYEGPHWMNSTWFRVQPIGFVRRPGARVPDPEAFYDPAAETALDFLPRWEPALEGIEEYSHLLVIFWLDRVRRARTPRVFAPEGRADLPEVGLFATRTPRRPNPLGVSTPRLLRREGRTLWVSGIDAWPETPIVDIKGYAPRDDLHPEATVPEWLNRLWALHDAER